MSQSLRGILTPNACLEWMRLGTYCLVLVIVHFFSGFHRADDIHSIVDQQVTRTGAHVFTISVDLRMQRQKADLVTHKSLPWWKERAHSGQLVSAGGVRHIHNSLPHRQWWTVATTFQ